MPRFLPICRSCPCIYALSSQNHQETSKQKLFPKRWITRQELQLLPRSELINSPYQRCERLSYLSEIDGLICANNCFLNSIELAKRKHPHSLHIDLRGFDGLITTSPLNIKPVNTRLFVQTVHDLIPLDYQRTRDHLPCFTRRRQGQLGDSSCLRTQGNTMN